MNRTRFSMVACAVAMALTALSAQANENIDTVVDVIRKANGGGMKISACAALEVMNRKPTTQDSARKRDEAIRYVSQKLKNNDAQMWRARGDAARKGLYGYPKDDGLALRYYERSKAPEAGLNAALMLFNTVDIAKNQDAAKQIINLLHKSGASKDESRGFTGAQSHYIAGVIYESGALGAMDLKKAFGHFRVAARNSHVLGTYRYLRLLVQSLPKLNETEQQHAMQEIRLMVKRWSWQSPDIMLLHGDLFAGKWFSDDADGFFSQYYWRVASRMTGSKEATDWDEALQARIRPLPKDKEKRLEESVSAAMRNVINTNHVLEFVDLCAD